MLHRCFSCKFCLLFYITLFSLSLFLRGLFYFSFPLWHSVDAVFLFFTVLRLYALCKFVSCYSRSIRHLAVNSFPVFEAFAQIPWNSMRFICWLCKSFSYAKNKKPQKGNEKEPSCFETMFNVFPYFCGKTQRISWCVEMREQEMST